MTELMVVVLIIGILLAIAVPTFISARDRAIVRAAQQRLSNVVTGAKNLYSDVGTEYTAQAAGNLTNLNTEVQPIQVLSTANTNPVAGTTSVVIFASTNGDPSIDPTGDTITFRTRDANDNIWQAVIAANGAVTYSQI